MKIAICINSSWNIYNYRKGLVGFFLGRGDEVVAIAPRDAYSGLLVEMGCAFEELAMSASGLNPISDLYMTARLRGILKKHRPDVFLSYTIKPNIYGAIACGTLGVPSIGNVSGLGTTFLWKGYVKGIAVKLYSFGFKFSDWVFFQNRYDREEFARSVNIDLKKTSLLPGSGIDIGQFKPTASARNDPPVFLMLARAIIEKGVHEFAGAIKIVKSKNAEAKFILLGGHDEKCPRAVPKSCLDRWAKDGLFEYGGHVDNVQPWIERADVVLLPSYREGTPRTLLEAGAMGKPLIATDVPGCNSVVKDGFNGFLCKVKDSEDLADKILNFLSLPPARQSEMGRNSRKHIERVFDERIVIDRYSGKINELTIRKR